MHTLYAPRSISGGRKQMSHTPVSMVLQPPLSTYHSSQTALYFSPPLLIIFAFFAFQFNLFFLFLLFSLFVFWTLLPLREFNKLRLFCFYHLFHHSVVITWEQCWRSSESTGLVADTVEKTHILFAKSRDNGVIFQVLQPDLFL